MEPAWGLRCRKRCGFGTYLESRAVTAPTRKRYSESLEVWFAFRDETAEVLEDDAAIDQSLCAFMTKLWAAGHQSNQGEFLMAGLLHHMPELSRFG